MLHLYLVDLLQGHNLKDMRIQGDTVRGYLKAAHAYLESALQRRVDITDPIAPKGQALYHPYLRSLIEEREKWRQPSEKKEPYTGEMLEWLYSSLLSSNNLAKEVLEMKAAVYDWLRLGIFTGSRVSEYAQDRLPQGRHWNAIPETQDAGIWAGWPLAFVKEDFTFMTGNIMIEPHKVLLLHKQGKIDAVQIRFRFDKSPRNFEKRLFPKSSHKIFCPVDAVVSILQRAHALGVGQCEPVGVYSAGLSYKYLRSEHVVRILRAACIGAYPNPNHYLRQHIHRLVSHSVRVTAAVCLQQGGLDEHEIAYKLRWAVGSVPKYLRDCWQNVGRLMEITVTSILNRTTHTNVTN